MDVQRTDVTRRKWIRRITFAGVVAAIGVPGGIYVSKLKPAAPLVEGSSVWPGQVKRGPMVRNVRGMGSLVAEDILIIPATTDGRVQRIMVRPGTAVKPDTVLLTLTNPDLELSVKDIEYQVKAAEARYTDLKVTLQSSALNDKASFAQLQSDYVKAKMVADRDEGLYKANVKVKLDYDISRASADQLANRLEIEKQRLAIKSDSVEAQLAVSRTEIDKLKALYKLKADQLDALNVRATVAGMLQELPVQEGQRIAAGTLLAKVAQPNHLKAELKVGETLAKDVVIGQFAEIDTRNGVIPGRVSRIDPAAKDGTVVVDVKLEGALPLGARPDLSVDGNIELEKLADVVYIDRPAFGQPNATVTMFKYDGDGKGAARVQVKFGRTAVNTIEVVEGLSVGDKVILSDTSQWDAYDRVRLN